MKEKQLEFNLKGISNQKELDKSHKEISDDAKSKFVSLLEEIINNKKYSKKDLKKLISLGKWINTI
jgi:hypothetical protein